MDAARTLAQRVEGLWGGSRGTPVHAKGNRRVYRIDDDDGPCFAKGGAADKRREVLREADVHAAMERAGLPVARIVATGEVGEVAWLVTRAAPGSTAREALDGASRQGGPARVRAIVDALADIVAAVHAAGFRHPDLTSDHVFVAPAPDGSLRATLIDVARAEGPAEPTLRQKARDLAALLCSLPRGVVGRGARTRLVRAAIGARGQELRTVLERIAKSGRKLALRTRWRHGYADVSPSLAEVVESHADPGTSLYGALLDAGWMEVVRTLPDRENRRFSAPGGRGYFMKVYPPTKQGFSPAQHEVAAIDAFARSGIPVCRREAYGEDVARGSFVVVRGCAGEPLDDLLRAGVTPAERRWLAAETGRIWRRMRLANLRHRDAYACHVFAERTPRLDGSPHFALRLIDLTRAGPAPFPRERWFVKDASQLWHGVPRPPVTRTDAVRWLRAYFAVPKLTDEAKRFARRVASKEGRIAARQRRKARKGSAR